MEENMVGSVMIDFWFSCWGDMIDVGIIGPAFGSSKKWSDPGLVFLYFLRCEVLYILEVLSIRTLIDILGQVRIILFIYSGIQMRA